MKLSEVEKKVDQLMMFRWQIIGGAGAISMTVTLLFQILKR